MTITDQLLPTPTEIHSSTPSASAGRLAPSLNIGVTKEERAFIRAMPFGRKPLREALAKPVPVDLWLQSLETGLMVSRASSGYLSSRSARRRAEEGPALELLRQQVIDRCLSRLPRDTVVTSEIVDHIETVVRTYIHAKGPRTNSTPVVLSLRIGAELLASLAATATALGVPRTSVIRYLIASHVEGARDSGFPLPGDALSTPMERRHETLLGMREGLLEMREAQAAETSLETVENTPQVIAA